MSPTRRAVAVAVICALAIGAGVAFGARALNAIVVPGLTLLAIGWLSVRRCPTPELTRSGPDPGFPGDRQAVAIDLDADGSRERTVGLYEQAEGGLSIPDERFWTTVPGRVSYECTLEARGEHTIGPALITVEDAFGLFRREFHTTHTTEALVYPPVRSLSGHARRLLAGRVFDPAIEDRGEFDSLREYVPGDPLRDVNWKASARREGLVVTEFAERTPETGLSVVAEAAPGQADAMASAAASVVLWLLEAGIEVELTTPDDQVSAADPTARPSVLTTLARANAGRVATAHRENTALLIVAEPEGVTLTVDGRTIPFERLLAGSPADASSVGRDPADGSPTTKSPAARATADGGRQSRSDDDTVGDRERARADENGAGP